MGCGLLINEYLHSFARHQNREYQYDVGSLFRDSHARISHALRGSAYLPEVQC